MQKANVKFHRWTDEEVKILCEFYCNTDIKKLSSILNKNIQSIRSKASFLGLKKDKQNIKIKEKRAIELLKTNSKKQTRKKLREEFGLGFSDSKLAKLNKEIKCFN